MWPFKRKPVQQFADYAAKKEPAPCGDQEAHYFWTEVEGWSCPICTRIEAEKKKEAEEDRMAEKIAQAVMRKMEGRDSAPNGRDNAAQRSEARR